MIVKLTSISINNTLNLKNNVFPNITTGYNLMLDELLKDETNLLDDKSDLEIIEKAFIKQFGQTKINIDICHLWEILLLSNNIYDFNIIGNDYLTNFAKIYGDFYQLNKSNQRLHIYSKTIDESKSEQFYDEIMAIKFATKDILVIKLDPIKSLLLIQLLLCIGNMFENMLLYMPTINSDIDPYYYIVYKGYKKQLDDRELKQQELQNDFINANASMFVKQYNILVEKKGDIKKIDAQIEWIAKYMPINKNDRDLLKKSIDNIF